MMHREKKNRHWNIEEGRTLSHLPLAVGEDGQKDRVSSPRPEVIRPQTPAGQKESRELPDYDDGVYAKALSRAADRVLNGENFTYEAKDDPIYQQYEDTYTRLGKRAMEDTVGQVSARTGGLASSYAATAASQSYQGYMDKLADKVPELYKAAYDMYRDGQRQDMERLELLRDMEAERYDRWRDQAEDYRSDRQFDRDVYEDDRDFDRGVYEDDRDYNRGVYEDDRDYDRGVYEDDRDYDRGVYEDDRDYERGVYEDDRDFERGVYEDDRDARLAAQKAAGTGKSTKSDKATMDWSAVEEWSETYGEDSVEDYIREHYKDLGYSSVSAALAGWNNHKRQRDHEQPQPPADPQPKPRPTGSGPLAPLLQGVTEGLTGEVIGPLVARLVEQGLDEETIRAILGGKKG
ncbi:MAG: hypothetical protein IJP02_02080 [Oscillospiraceae bacterium]|nr:hypothetical protein [Oscillospiraceae bacterium]